MTSTLRNVFAAVLFGSVFFAPPLARAASILEVVRGADSLEGVKLIDKATLKLDHATQPLNRVGVGLRRKKIAVFWAKVYVAQVLTQGSKSLQGSKPDTMLTTLAQDPNVVLNLQFLRNLSAPTVRISFGEGLKANGFDPNAEEFQPFFKAIADSGDITEGQAMNLVFTRSKTGVEEIELENGSGKLFRVASKPGTAKKILSIWFGKPEDSGLEELQEQFSGKRT